MRFSLAFVLLLFLFPTAEAKLFQNSYVSFEIPEDWECRDFGADWVCHSKFQEKKVEALITSTAKVAGPLDTLDQYMDYLQQPKTWSTLKNEQITSEKMTPAKKVFINKFQWVDSIHKNSEVKSYISRYAGTVCCEGSSSKLGILLVLSAHQDHYTKYSASFVKTVNSLRVLDINKAVSKIRANQAVGQGVEMSNYLEGLFEEESPVDMAGASGTQLFGMEPMQLGLLLLAAFGVLGYLLFRKKKRRRRRRKR